LRVESGGGR